MLTRIDKDLSAIAGADPGAFIAMVSSDFGTSPPFPLVPSFEHITPANPQRKAAHPMGRNVKVSDVTDAVSWLASDGCKFVTGVLVPITVSYDLPVRGTDNQGGVMP